MRKFYLFVFASLFGMAMRAVTVDCTSKVDVTWGGAGGCDTQYAPAVTPYGSTTAQQMRENYQRNVDATGVLISQTVTGLDNGTYTVELYANAFFTPDRGFDSSMEEGAMDVAYVFANGDTVAVVGQIATATEANGEYTLTAEVTDGTLTMGIGKRKAGTNWHTIQIKSLTLTTSDDEAYTNAVAAAQAIDQTQPMNKEVLAALQEAIAQYGKDVADENKADAATALNTAANAAEASIEAYATAANVLPQMKALTESTNVYTEEALNEYYTQWQTKYDEGTLTTEEASGLQNPYAKPGWHVSITCDNFLLSAWDAEPDFASFYYINTWSTEGDTDGSEFKVPFFEYWTTDANTLSADTLAATMSNLPAGDYTVSAVVRVRLSDGATDSIPSGIFMQANDGELVSVCEGTAYGKLYVDTVTVAGTVGEDGVLNIRFVVTDSTNVSWLSFQNVNYAAAEEEEQVREIPVTIERYTNLGYTGQTADLDFTEALAYLGIESVSEATVIGINVSNDSIVTDGMSVYDGWHNAAGDFQTWGDNAAVCVKFNPTAESAQLYDICDMGNDNVPAAGESFTCKWGLQANGKTVVYVITINFSEAPKVTYPIVKTITINHTEVEKTAYSETTETFDVNEVIEALGAPDIASCEQFIVNASDTSFVSNSTDGWRDANGDIAGWGSTSGVCVKIDNPASGKINFIGCFDDTHEAGEVYHALWGFVYNEQAVLIDVVITFATEEAAGINSVSNSESLKSAAIYNLSGQRVKSIVRGGLYIINGKKVLLK